MTSPSLHKGNPLEGYFQKNGSLLQGKNGHDLLIRTRGANKTTGSKTSQFILMVDKTTGTRKYISSLWQTRQGGVYEFEYQGIRYGIDLNSTRPFIHPLREVFGVAS